MKRLIFALLLFSTLFVQGQTSPTIYTGTILPTDNHYITTTLNGQFRKIQLYRIGQDRQDSAVTAMATYAKLQRLLDSLTAIRSTLATKQAAGNYVTTTDLSNGLATKQAAGDYATNASLTTGLGGKVDIVAGKGLSENDFSNAKDAKLQGIQNGATANDPNDSLYAFHKHTGHITAAQIDPTALEELDLDAIEDRSIAALRAGGSTIINQVLGMDMLTTNTTNTASVWDGTNRCQPMYFTHRDTINQLGFEVVTSASVDLILDNNTKIGFYKYNGDGTISLVASTANIADTYFESGGVKTFSITATVGGGSSYIVTAPGLYFVSLLYNQTSATTAPVLRANTRGGANITGGTASNKFHFQTTATDLPSSVTLSSASTSGYSIWIGAFK